jgi:hypothetical protein
MKTMRTALVLSACLLGALSAGWWLTRTGSNSHIATPFNQADSSRIPVAKTTVQSTLPPAAAPSEAKILKANEHKASADSESPDNSLDLDQNRDWARKNPAEASTWLATAPDGPQLEAVTETVCSEMARTNPAEAMVLAGRCRISNTNFMNNLLVNLTQQWAEQDMPAACAWTAAKPAGEDRDRLLGRIAFVKSKSHPEAAARFVAEQMSPGAVQDEAAITVIYQWALRDANAALAWVQTFPEGNLRYRAMQEVQNIQSARQTMSQPAGS